MHVVYKSQILSFTFFNPKICIAMVLKKKKRCIFTAMLPLVFLILSIYYFFILFSVFVPAVVPPPTHYLLSRWYIISPQPHFGELRLFFFSQGKELLIYTSIVILSLPSTLSVRNVVCLKLEDIL